MEAREGETTRPALPGDVVGLGQVVANPGGLGGRGIPASADEPVLDEASEESFPASDPPATGSAGRPGIGATDRPTA